MKLALIRRNFSASGGAELYTQRLVKALVQRGHHVHLYAENWSDPGQDVTFHQVPVKAQRAARPALFARAVRDMLALESFDCVFSLERTISQDVYRAGDGLHRRWLEQRRLFAPWWRRPFVGLGAFHRTMLELEQRTFSPANTRHVIVNSTMVREEILKKFAFPAERIHLVRNGIETGRFTSTPRDEARQRFALKPNDYTLLFVGSGWERKGLAHLLRAFVRLDPAYKLLVVGKGRRPSSPPANVTFLGVMPDVECAYAAADLFVTLPIYEPSANVCFEALASGAPIITTRFDGAAEVIQPGVNGSIIDDPRDTTAVITAIDTWRRRGSIRVQPTIDLSLERNVAETIAILELAARERKAAA